MKHSYGVYPAPLTPMHPLMGTMLTSVGEHERSRILRHYYPEGDPGEMAWQMEVARKYGLAVPPYLAQAGKIYGLFPTMRFAGMVGNVLGLPPKIWQSFSAPQNRKFILIGVITLGLVATYFVMSARKSKARTRKFSAPKELYYNDVVEKIVDAMASMDVDDIAEGVEYLTDKKVVHVGKKNGVNIWEGDGEEYNYGDLMLFVRDALGDMDFDDVAEANNYLTNREIEYLDTIHPATFGFLVSGKYEEELVVRAESTPNYDTMLQDYVDYVNGIYDEYYSTRAKGIPKEHLVINPGRTWDKLVQRKIDATGKGGSAWGFVSKDTGFVHKASSWSQPNKRYHVADISDRDTWKRAGIIGPDEGAWTRMQIEQARGEQPGEYHEELVVRASTDISEEIPFGAETEFSNRKSLVSAVDDTNFGLLADNLENASHIIEDIQKNGDEFDKKRLEHLLNFNLRSGDCVCKIGEGTKKKTKKLTFSAKKGDTIFEFEREEQVKPSDPQASMRVDKKKTVIAVRTDGKVLSKFNIHYMVSSYEKAHWYTYGWKRTKQSVDVDSKADKEQFQYSMAKRGFTQTKGEKLSKDDIEVLDKVNAVKFATQARDIMFKVGELKDFTKFKNNKLVIHHDRKGYRVADRANYFMTIVESKIHQLDDYFHATSEIKDILGEEILLDMEYRRKKGINDDPRQAYAMETDDLMQYWYSMMQSAKRIEKGATEGTYEEELIVRASTDISKEITFGAETGFSNRKSLVSADPDAVTANQLLEQSITVSPRNLQDANAWKTTPDLRNEYRVYTTNEFYYYEHGDGTLFNGSDRDEFDVVRTEVGTYQTYAEAKEVFNDTALDSPKDYDWEDSAIYIEDNLSPTTLAERVMTELEEVDGQRMPYTSYEDYELEDYRITKDALKSSGKYEEELTVRATDRDRVFRFEMPYEDPDDKTFFYLTMRFDVKKAKKLINKNPRKIEDVELENLAKMLPERHDPNATSWKVNVLSIGMDWDRVDNDPSIDLSVPIVVANLGEEMGYIVIDGWHRIGKGVTEDMESLPGYVLTEKETEKVAPGLKDIKKRAKKRDKEKLAEEKREKAEA